MYGNFIKRREQADDNIYITEYDPSNLSIASHGVIA